MREAIRSRLLSDVSELIGGVFEPGIADKNTQKPYAVVKFVGEGYGPVKNTFDRTVEIWVYALPTTFKILDAINEKVIKAVTKEEMITDSGLRFVLELTNIGTDGFFDEELESFTKPVTFRQAFVRE